MRTVNHTGMRLGKQSALEGTKQNVYSQNEKLPRFVLPSPALLKCAWDHHRGRYKEESSWEVVIFFASLFSFH
jgi:hypothetical protein